MTQFELPLLSPHSPLRNGTYRRLFAAQLVALAGTGISTIALALLAFQLQPNAAAAVLGSVLSVKMVVYVSVSLASHSLLKRISPTLSTKGLLIALDLIRALTVLALPFVHQAWQVYVLIAALSAGSAVFKPVFQACLPDVLPDQEQYTRALSLTRLAYDLENLLSPTLAALLLLWLQPRWLFVGTAAGFVLSSLLVARCTLPASRENSGRPSLRAAFRSFLRTPRLRGVLALNLCVAAAGSMMIVNGVHYVRVDLGLGESHLALAMLATGAGSMGVALILPRLLRSLSDRFVMLGGAVLTCCCLFLGCLRPQFTELAGLWFALGAATAAIQTPVGRLLTRSVHAEARTGAFAVQFSLSHACWLLTYGLAAWLPVSAHSSVAFASLGAVATLALGVTLLVWRRAEIAVEHTHDLPPGHPHLNPAGGQRHSHVYVIDDHHQHWPGDTAKFF